jgi:dTDP-4-amino-4,6-dideoxygalactose transaminase
MSDKKRIFLASPHMGGLEKEFIKEAFETNWIAPLGPNVDIFEKEVSDMVGIDGALALSSGTAAMHLALRYLGVGRGDIVFCSSLTFAASCNPIIYEGAEPVFIDSEPESWNMSPKVLKKAFEESKREGRLPKAVIVVSLYGQSADMDPIKEICDNYNVPIIEDAAEALGATYKGKFSGTTGKFGVYSFNGNKIITTSGGGMLISKDKKALEKARFWATQARDAARHYQHSELGFNYRMSNVLAGIGRGQLRVLIDRVMKKKSIYQTYKNELSDIGDIEFMPICRYGKPNYWLSVMTIKEKSSVRPIDIMVTLEKENIESRPVWKPMHLQPFYERYKFYSHNDDGISIAEDVFNRGICLPSDTKMTEEDLERVISIVKGVFIKHELTIDKNDSIIDLSNELIRE